MASINGITIKNLKHFADHEGMQIAQGNIYMDNKKLGLWSQDAWGGPDRFDFDEKILSDRIKDYYKKNPPLDSIKMMQSDVKDLDFDNLPRKHVKDLKFMMEEIFMSELLNLIDNEKEFKKAVKQGYTAIGTLEYYPVKAPRPLGQIVYTSAGEKGVKEAFKEKLDKYPYAYTTTYNSIDDFVI